LAAAVSTIMPSVSAAQQASCRRRPAGMIRPVVAWLSGLTTATRHSSGISSPSTIGTGLIARHNAGGAGCSIATSWRPSAATISRNPAARPLVTTIWCVPAVKPLVSWRCEAMASRKAGRPSGGGPLTGGRW
jgi:hypothetical protein